MRVAITWAACAASSLACAAPALAQNAQSAELSRPVIGLVLSGGGARGGAHLGVIKALEELRVPVDVIAGTSIGAAIGGLYASGMTVEELEEFVRGLDWDAAFLNSTPRRLESFRRKREDELLLLEARPGVSSQGISLPAGVVQGQVIDTIMARVTLPVAAVDDFDALAIPFRAVAGDLESGEAVVLAGGNLGRAIRASMTVPAAMTPIEIDGRLLVDGGIANNLPVDIAQQMGAERIIAIDISEQPGAREGLLSIVNVTSQMTTLLTTRTTLEQIERLSDDDILLAPEFSADDSAVSFESLPETIETGYVSIMNRQAQFLPYQLNAQDYAAYKERLPNPRTTELPTIDFIRVGDTQPLAPSVIEARIEDVVIGQPLDLDTLEQTLNRVYGLGVYQNVRYALVEDGAEHGLDIDLISRSVGLDYVQLGLRYASVSDENSRLGIAASYVRTGINELGGEWRSTFSVGEDPGLRSDWYQPFGPKALTFVNPSLEIDAIVRNIFVDRELAAEVKLRSAIFEFGVGREFLGWGELRGGFRVGSGDTRLRVGDPAAVPFDGFHRGELFTRFSVDTLDDISFPLEGHFAAVEWRGSNASVLSADGDYDQLLLEWVHAKTWGRHTLLSTVRYDATVSGQTPMFALFDFGGFRDLSGLHQDEITGQHVARIGASYYRRIANSAFFPAFVGFSAEVGNAWTNRRDISLKRSIWGGSIWAGVDTPAGPVFIAYGSSEGGHDAVYVFLGHLF